MENQRVVLVADDEFKIRSFVRDILLDEGYEILLASDGAEAVMLSHQYRGAIDLMLTDLNMPHLDGFSAFQRISAERPGMKVLFISGDTFRPQLSGSWPFLSKPFGLQEILALVREILHGGPPSDLQEIHSGKTQTVTAT